MTNRSNLFAASALALLAAAGCTPTDSDQPVAIAKSGNTVVISTSTVTTGGFGCGGLTTPGDGPLYVSNDRGATFTQLATDNIDAPVAALAVHQQTFYALHSRYSGYAIEASQDGRTWTQVAAGSDDALEQGYGLLSGIASRLHLVRWLKHGHAPNIINRSVGRIDIDDIAIFILGVDQRLCCRTPFSLDLLNRLIALFSYFIEFWIVARFVPNDDVVI